ncbi:hypothetical protein Nans01_05680 [Nocardiopsis ansamitocini]|uniref:NodB homology domain-containing protein n=1 Tax=Nocardiopsis ansamitocini TaxID=1670832 RepID=A0A9W6UH02_9ACTN|nr:hypothetical protein Nans01_05680 [Nocardiopsis ansamitocini]
MVDRALVVGLGEESDSGDEGGVRSDVSHPTIDGAEPLNERLAELTAQELADFKAANPGAKAFGLSWELTAAGDDVVGVRFTRDEEDSDGPRTGYATYWYDAATKHPAYSTELLAGQEQLVELNGIVKEHLSANDKVDVSAIHPILRLYDSMGFNPAGDLVVEFDAGEVASVSEGRVHTVVKRDEAAPLLSDFGTRARDTSTRVTPDFAVDPSPAAEPSTEPSAAAAAEPVAIPGVFSQLEPPVDCSTAEAKCVALTFDDGPGDRTEELLDVLAEYDAKATFFLTGGPVREHPTTVRREYAEGHELANHTVNHPDLRKVSDKRLAEELSTVNALVRRETGYTMDLMRPPYGATNDKVAEAAEEHGLAEIIWSLDTNDWKDRNAGVVTSRTIKGVKPGSIVLMHDIHSTTIDSVEKTLKKLTERGYTMVTVGQLLGETEPGQSYFDGYPAAESPSPSPEA